MDSSSFVHSGGAFHSKVLCCCNPQEVQDLAAACCLTAKQLHASHLVYKDWRHENVVRHVDTKEHMVVDLESVSTAPALIAAEHELPCWGPHAVENQHFTEASDMYQVIGDWESTGQLQPARHIVWLVGQCCDICICVDTHQVS